jgi:cobalt/nickel transport system permease protein
LNQYLIEKYAGLSSPLHRLDARSKVLAYFLLIVVSVSTPPSFYLAFAAYFGIILASMIISKVPSRYYFARLMLAVPFVFLVAVSIPFMHPASGAGSISMGIIPISVSRTGLLIFWNVLAKAIIGIMSLSIISATTPFPEFLKALEFFRIPKFFTLLAGFTYSYIFILLDEIVRMKRARDSRLYGGRWIWHTRVIGQMIGTLFLRSYERGERVYVAMVSRGFDGSWPGSKVSPLKIYDVAFAGGMLAIIAAIRIGSIWIL